MLHFDRRGPQPRRCRVPQVLPLKGLGPRHRRRGINHEGAPAAAQ